jgi:hypothetical protein
MTAQTIEHTDTGRSVGSYDAGPAPPLAAPGPQEPGPRGQWRKWLLPAASVLLLIVVAVLIVLFGRAAGERDDAQDALADTETALQDAETTLADTETALQDAETTITETDEALEGARADLERANAELATAERAGTELLTASFAVAGIDDDAAACLATELYDARGPAILSDIAASTYAGTDAITSAEVQFAQAAQTCGVDLEDLAAPGVAATETQDGADPQAAEGSVIDTLYAECEAGSGKACDALFELAEPSSKEELAAMTCGGRFLVGEAPVYCEGNM